MKQVTKEHWNGYDTYVLHSGELEVTMIPRLGNNIISVRDLKLDRDIVRRPGEEELAFYLQKPYHFGLPILIPPGRIRKGQFEFDGVPYQFDRNTANDNHIHGLHHNQSWRCSDIEEDEEGCSVTTELLTESDPHWMEQFPIPLRLEMTYRLQGAVLSQTLRVTNLGEKAAPFGLGYHTWFMVDGEPERWRLKLPVNGVYEQDAEQLPTGIITSLDDLEQLSSGLSLKGTNLDTLLRATEGPAEALLTRDDGYQIRYTADEQYYKYWVLYTKGECDQYLCIEPYTWLPDAPNSPDPVGEAGLIRLEPQQSIDLKTQIHIIYP